MAIKDLDKYIKFLSQDVGPESHLFSRDYDKDLSVFGFGDSYENDKALALETLMKKGLNQRQAQDIVDLYATKKSHYATKNGQNMAKYYGKFENGVATEDAQKFARDLKKIYPNHRIVYGIHFTGEDMNNSGLKKPLVLDDEQLMNLNRAIAYNKNGDGKKANAIQFQIDTEF